MVIGAQRRKGAREPNRQNASIRSPTSKEMKCVMGAATPAEANEAKNSRAPHFSPPLREVGTDRGQKKGSPIFAGGNVPFCPRTSSSPCLLAPPLSEARIAELSGVFLVKAFNIRLVILGDFEFVHFVSRLQHRP